MVVNKASGEFRYSYTKETAHMNAFISLAPYCLPLCTILAVPLSGAFLGLQHPLLPLIVGVSTGLDLNLNLRDISWYQTDLTEVLGSYSLSLWYIIVLNITLWIPVSVFALCGLPGLQLLASGLWQIMAQVMGFHAEPPWSS